MGNGKEKEKGKIYGKIRHSNFKINFFHFYMGKSREKETQVINRYHNSFRVASHNQGEADGSLTPF